MALIVVSLVAALGAGFLRLSAAVARRQTSEVETMRAFYLAEAGLSEAFQALRIGRTGQVGSEEAPAAYGDGLLWVDALDTADGQVRLESTALCGSGRASLALVVEPVDIPLGFFSDEDLVVDSVLLVDGFDSQEATYEEEVSAVTDLQLYADQLATVVGGQEIVMKYVDADLPHELAAMAGFTTEQEAELVSLFPDLREMCFAGTLFPSTSINIAPVDADVTPTFGTGGTGGTLEPDNSLEESTSSPDGSTDMDPVTSGTTTTTTPTIPDVHTTSGGMLGSNGSVVFTAPSGEPVEIYGDVVPGPDGTVQGVDGVSVTGDTDPRTTAIELPEVEVPGVALAAPVRHEGLLPLLVSPGTTGHEHIEVAPDAELVLRGPATVVIGTLVLEPGAILTLDTRDGDVELYVTGGMDLQPGSVVVTTSDMPDELTIQVAPIASSSGDAPVSLEATSQFHGTIYAPDTEVRVGSDFEVFGGIVARRLELGAGAQLHFDNSGFEGTAIPRIIAWRIIEVPTTVRSRRDPYELLAVERGTLQELSMAHDLASVTLTVEYVDHGGTTRSYSGTEDLFDWDLVAEVLRIERVGDRPLEDPESAGDQPAIRTDVQAALDGYPSTMNSSDLVDLLIPRTPLSADEWAAVEAAGLAAGQLSRLRSADADAGGLGGI